MAWPETGDLARDLDEFFLHLGNPHGSIDRFVARVRVLQLRTGAWAVPVAPHQHGDPCPNCGTDDDGGTVELVEDDGDGWTRYRCAPYGTGCGWGGSHRPPPPLDGVAAQLREAQRLAGKGVAAVGPRAALHVAIESALALAEYYRTQDEGEAAR
jgi:hypothetical protein